MAEIDPSSAVAGSTRVRSKVSHEAEKGVIEIRDVTLSTVLGQKPAGRDGDYAITVSPPLISGHVIQAFNVTRDYCSSGIKVTDDAAPIVAEPLKFGDTKVRGVGTPGHQIAIVNALTGQVLGQTPTNLDNPGDGSFQINVTPLVPFHTIKAVDLTAMPIKASAHLPVLGKSSRSIVPPATCPMKTGNQTVGGFSATLYDCGLQNPRGIAAGIDGKVYVTAGAPPSDIVNTAPAGIFRLNPLDGSLSLFSPVHGVGLKFGPPSLNFDLFIARPRMFFVRGLTSINRGDGEVFRIDRGTGTPVLYRRIIDTAPTGLGFDTTGASSFNGNLLVTSFTGTQINAVDDLQATSSVLASGLEGVWGIAFGGSAFNNDAFVSQPSTGNILRVHNAMGSINITPFATGLVSPTDLAFGPGGAFGTNLFVADPGAGQIVMIGPAGTKTVFGTKFIRPFGLTFEPMSQTLYVSDYESGEIIKVQ